MPEVRRLLQALAAGHLGAPDAPENVVLRQRGGFGTIPDVSATLEELLTAGLKARTRKKAHKSEEKAYGGPLSEEVATLIGCNERWPLDEQSWRAGDAELRPLCFEEPFGIGGKDAAKAQLERAPQLGWPVYFEAHFWNAFPIGATGGGDYLLAQLQSGEGVFRYDHETGELSKSADSLAAWVAASRGIARAPERPAQRDARFDPPSLYARSYWLTAALCGRVVDDLEAELRRAPTLAAFAEEKALLAGAPHLALYWLFAHAVLGNEAALSEALAATAKSKHAFVASARALCKKLVEDRGFGVGGFTAAQRARLDDLLDGVCPASLLEAPRAKPPGNDALKALASLAEREGGAFAEAVSILARFERAGGSPGRSNWPKNWVEVLADPRLRDVMLDLFRAGQEVAWTEPKCSDWFIEPLALLGDATVTEAFIESLGKRCHRNRRAKLIRALCTVRDPRVDARFEELLGFLEQKKYADDPDPLVSQQLAAYVEASATRYRALGDRARLMRLVVAVLTGTGKLERATRHAMAELAVEARLEDAVPALQAALSVWTKEARPPFACQEDFHVLGVALAQLSPRAAAETFVPVWQKFLDYGPLEACAQNQNLLDIGTAVLVPLLGSSAKDEYLPIARRLAERIEPSSNAARHLATGMRLASSSFEMT